MSHITKVYFDTNVFSHIANRNIPKNTFEHLKQCILRHKISAHYTPITFNEIGAGILAENKTRYSYYQKVLRLTKELCGNNILEYPDQAIQRVIWGEPFDNPDNVEILNHYRDSICYHKSYKELALTDFFSGFQGHVKTYLKGKKAWFRGINKGINKALREIERDYEEKKKSRNSKRHIKRERREEIITALRDPKLIAGMIDNTILKVTPVHEETLIGDANADFVDKIRTKLEAYYTAYLTIYEKVLTNNYKVRDSDFNDIHFLAYLSKGKHIGFITQDNKLRKNISASKQGKQVLSVADLLACYHY